VDIRITLCHFCGCANKVVVPFQGAQLPNCSNPYPRVWQVFLREKLRSIKRRFCPFEFFNIDAVWYHRDLLIRNKLLSL